MWALKEVNKYISRYKKLLFLGIFYVITSNVFALYTPQLFRLAIDTVIDNINTYNIIRAYDITTFFDTFQNTFFLFIGIMILLTTLIRGILMFFMRQTLIVMSRYVEYDLKNDLYKHYQILSPSFYKRNNTGDLMARISEDVSRVRMYVGPAIMYIINLVAMFAMVIYTMFSINAYLSFWVLLPLPILSFSIYNVSKVINKKSEQIQAALSALTSKAQEVYSGIRIIHAFARSGQVLREFEQKADDYRDKAISLNRVESYFQPLMLLMVGASTVLAIFIGGNEMARGRFTAGNIAEFVYYINMLTWPVASLGWAISLVQRAEASQSRINEFLNHTPDILSPDKPLQITECNNITFQHSTLQYPDTGITAVHDFNLSIPRGQKVAIVGKTGAGKSTIAELLLRNYDTTQGEILINGINIKQISLEVWRGSIGYISQDIFLFSDTITENIRFGKADATFEEIQHYAKVAQVHQDVLQLPKGYDTIVGERGVMLSGGQKQRISIARALIRQPQLLIMDDCLSAVDADTETKILQNLFEIFGDKTVVFITHKTYIAQQFDKIVLIEEGKLCEEGTHGELLDMEGKYAALYHLQNAESSHSNYE